MTPKRDYSHSLRQALFSITVAVCILILQVQGAQADAGPKPTMEFSFVQETEPPLTIVEATLLQCEDAACSTSTPLEEAGPQRFTCTADHCSSMAYGYSTYNRLVIRFSDDRTRESNVFTKQAFQANYQVTIRETDLAVEEKIGLPNPLILFLVGGTVAFVVGGVLITILLVMVFFWIWRVRKGPIQFSNLHGLFVVVWILALIAAIGGGFFSLTLPITLGLEAALALLYARLRRHDGLTLMTLTLLVNLITQPLLWIVLVGQSGESLLWVLGLFEVGIVLVEAVLLYLMQGKELPFKEALILSLLLNVDSFVVGLFLPI